MSNTHPLPTFKWLSRSLSTCAKVVTIAGLTAVGLVTAGAADLGNRSISLYEPFLEWSLPNASYSGNAYDLIATVTFEHDGSDANHTTEMFYDGDDTWKFRFTGTETGQWTFSTSSADPDLDGHTGTVDVTAAQAGAEGFMVAVDGGNKWARQTPNGPRAFVPNYVMINSTLRAWDTAGEREALLDEFMGDHGFTGVHPAVVGAQFFDADSDDRFDLNSDNSANLSPDPEAFEILEAMVQDVHARGGAVHFWLWGDSGRDQNLSRGLGNTGGINGVVDKRLQRYIAARLGPLPGWSMGYGYDLFEWVSGAELTEWHNFMQEKMGWFHFLGARGNKNEIANSQLSEQMSYVGYEQHFLAFDFSEYVDTYEDRPGRPSFSEDRFRVTSSDAWKDPNNEETRRLMWTLTMAGGIAGIWGDLDPEPVVNGEGFYGSGPYDNKEQLKTFSTFWNDQRRFLASMESGNQGGDSSTRVLVTDDRENWVAYKESTNSISVDLSGFSGTKPVVAVDAQSSYAEIDLGTVGTGNQTFNLPSTSDWAIAIGEFPVSQSPPLPAVEPAGGALAGERYRLIVSSDIGGNDPDDIQSLVHLLVYADLFDIEGLISSPPYAGRKQDILDVLDAYETDYAKLSSYSSLYPTADALRALSFQGETDNQTTATPTRLSAGAQHIIDRAKADDPRPLYITVWGAITDVAQAVHADPTIKNKIRVYSIGSWNTFQDSSNARNYLYNNHPDLWWIENDTTFRGMYTGGEMGGDLGNGSFLEQHVEGHGALGDYLVAAKDDIKMGDTPSILYLLTGNPDDPTGESWGGSFAEDDHSDTFWTDDTDPALKEGNRNGAKTVNKWRENYLRHWEGRMDRALQADDGTNNPPQADAGEDLSALDSDGNGIEQVTLDGTRSSDPDFDELSYAWSWEAGSAVGSSPTITLSTEGSPHLITLTVTDPGGLFDSSDVSVSVTAPPTASPTGLTAETASASRIVLAWEDNATDETGYCVERSQGTGSSELTVSLVSYTAGNNAPTVETANSANSFQEGALQANDRSNTLTAVPSQLDGASRLLTARSDRLTSPVGAVYTVNLSASGTIYAMVDGRYEGQKLSWMGSEWTDSGLTAESSEGATNPWTLWQRDVAAPGDVTLGVDTENYSGVTYVFMGDLWEKAADLGANAVSFADTSLDPETTYSYRVRALGDNGDSSWAGPASATTSAVAAAFEAWRARNFSSAELNDPGISGPNAAPGTGNVNNRMRFALGYGAWESVTPLRATPMEVDGVPVFAFQRNLEDGQFDLMIWTSLDLSGWSTSSDRYILESVSDTPATPDAPATRLYHIHARVGESFTTWFLRLAVD